MSTKTLFAATAALALSLAVAAQAAPANPDIVSVRVPLADLNLNHEAGAKAALTRIRKAANFVCGGDLSPQLLRLSGPYRACQRDAVDRAVVRLDQPMVSALNARRTPSVQMAGR